MGAAHFVGQIGIMAVCFLGALFAGWLVFAVLDVVASRRQGTERDRQRSARQIERIWREADTSAARLEAAFWRAEDKLRHRTDERP